LSSDAGRTWNLQNTPAGQFSQYLDAEFYPPDPNVIIVVGDSACISTDGGASWETFGNPNPGRAIELDPIQNNRIYIACEQPWEARQLLWTDDLGETWHNITGDMDSCCTATELAIDPSNNQTIYLSRLHWTGQANILVKTTDGGGHWFDISPTGLIWNWATCVRVSPLNNQAIFVSTMVDGIFRSNDGGLNWERINGDIPTLVANTITVDPGDGTIYYGTQYDGIYRSMDNGENWQDINNGIFGISCRGLAVNPRNPDSIIAVGPDAAFISVDRSQSWNYMRIDNPLPFAGFQWVIYDPIDPDYIYISYRDEGGYSNGGVYSSSDGGLNWQFRHNGFPETPVYFGRMAIANRMEGSRVFVGTYANGLFYSDDRGESWQACPNLPFGSHLLLDVSPVDPRLIFVSGDNGIIHKSNDGGMDWVDLMPPANADGVREIICDPQNAGVIYASYGGIGIFKSTNSGQSWQDINSDMPRHTLHAVTGIAINPLNTDEIYANSYSYSMFVTYDGGEHWHPFQEGLRPFYSFVAKTVIHPADTSKIYIATSGQSVWDITRTMTGIEDNNDQLPLGLNLACYPNPFNTATTIKVASGERAEIFIFDITGRRVAALHAEYGRAVWDARDFSSGIYFARARGIGEDILRMVLLK
jgi:photosystem II stability/assembly factor-like uncharacterized protein